MPPVLLSLVSLPPQTTDLVSQLLNLVAQTVLLVVLRLDERVPVPQLLPVPRLSLLLPLQILNLLRLQLPHRVFIPVFLSRKRSKLILPIRNLPPQVIVVNREESAVSLEFLAVKPQTLGLVGCYHVLLGLNRELTLQLVMPNLQRGNAFQIAANLLLQ